MLSFKCPVMMVTTCTWKYGKYQYWFNSTAWRPKLAHCAPPPRLNNVKKNCTFLRGGLPLSNSRIEAKYTLHSGMFQIQQSIVLYHNKKCIRLLWNFPKCSAGVCSRDSFGRYYPSLCNRVCVWNPMWLKKRQFAIVCLLSFHVHTSALPNIYH